MKLEELIELFLKKGTRLIFIGQKHIQRTRRTAARFKFSVVNASIIYERKMRVACAYDFHTGLTRIEIRNPCLFEHEDSPTTQLSFLITHPKEKHYQEPKYTNYDVFFLRSS